MFKTAVAGEDPNWGRIAMGIGKSGELVDQKKLRIKIGNFIVAENGKISESYDEQKHPVKRMMMISKEVERLCSYTLDEMNGWYNQLLPRLKHNHDKLFDQQSLNDFVNLLHHNTDISINE